MHGNELAAVTRVVEAAGEGAAPLRDALAKDPHSVRVVHIGHEVLGAFLLSYLPGDVEEVSCLTLNEEGTNSGAEPLVLDYVVKAARFSRKKAVEVVAAPGSSEAVHLEALGFAKSGDASGGRARWRLALRGK